MQRVYILQAKRTAIGTFAGTLKDTGAAELGAAVVKALLRDSGVEPGDVGEVIMGNVLSAGLGQNVSRQVALAGGLPQDVPAFTVNKVCASGMKAVELAYQAIALGNARAVIAGGCENMNLAPYIAKGVRSGLRLNDGVLQDTLVSDGLWCAMTDCLMGITAENLADRYQISREAQDRFALQSHEKALRAGNDGAFKDEIEPVGVKQRKQTITFEADEHPRADTTLETLARLRPVFKSDGTVTAGNASGINDAAAGLILAGADLVKRRKLEPMAEVIGFASAAVDPATMGIGPVPAIRELAEKTGTDLDRVDVFELNEAFAAQSLAVLEELKLAPDRVNPHGGAIALGHPIGASGARIVVTLLHTMKRQNLATGVASLCVGGGMGMAMLVKTPND